MRSLYLQNAQHLLFDLEGQVAELNKRVLLDAVPRVMSKVEQYLGYTRDQGSTIRPIPRGELATMAWLVLELLVDLALYSYKYYQL